MPKVIDWEKAKKKVLIKKSAIQEFKNRYGRKGALAYLPRKQREKLNCPKCGGFVKVEDDTLVQRNGKRLRTIIFSCVNCGWRGQASGVCKFCNGHIVRAGGKEFCFHCLDKF